MSSTKIAEVREAILHALDNTVSEAEYPVTHAKLKRALAALADAEPGPAIVYAVVFSDYDPAEVAALYANREAAEADRDARNARDPDVQKAHASGGTAIRGPWEVVEWTVAETYEPGPPR